MIDLRPVGYVIGLAVAVLGLSMLLPMAVDMLDGNNHWPVFAISGVVSVLIGVLLAIASANGTTEGLNIQQTFLVTTLVWAALPVFGALPFALGATEARFVDAYFEAMSGLTTTGATVFSKLDELPRGLLLWRGLLQWYGGVGIVVVGMIFLPTLRVGGMQIFRSEGFDTLGKILPRAGEMARQIGVVYLLLTVACALSYAALGMEPFDALVHTLTTVSTGGFSTRDVSFGYYQGPLEYVSVIFMVLASLPFIRFVQLMSGSIQPMFRDVQVRAYVSLILLFSAMVTIYRIVAHGDHPEHSFREAIFNITSIFSGTGYSSVDYQLWGPFPVVLFFMVGLIGGCAGSTGCSVKIFRYQLLWASIKAQIRKIHSPSGVFVPKYDGRIVPEEVMSSVMAFFTMFMVVLALLAAALALTGLDAVTSISGAASALANIGPGLGDTIGPSGNFGPLNDTAKWLLIVGMLIGRLELMSVLVLFSISFWRR